MNINESNNDKSNVTNDVVLSGTEEKTNKDKKSTVASIICFILLILLISGYFLYDVFKSNISLKGFDITIDEITLGINETEDIEKYIELENIELSDIKFESSDVDIAYIEDTTIVAPLKEGEATITASYKNITKKILVEVKNNKENFYFKRNTLNIVISKIVNISSYLYLNQINIDEVKFSVENENVLKIEDTYVKPQKIGTTVIEATYLDKSDKITINIINEREENLLGFNQDSIEINLGETDNIERYLDLKKIKIEDIDFIVADRTILELENNYINSKNEGSTTIEAKYLDSNAKIVVNVINKSNKFLYFYKNNDETIKVTENLLNDTKEEYLGKYKCSSSKCTLRQFYYGQGSDINSNTIVLYDSDTFPSHYILYNYKIESILSQEVVSVVSDKIIVEKNEKYAIMNFDGQLISQYYDNIFRVKEIIVDNNQSINYMPLQNYSFLNKVVEFVNNSKSGLLSFEDGSEITEAIYDYISIYNDNIVVTKDNLDYVMNNAGQIIGSGYAKILHSTDKIIIIEENKEIDIIDYDGNSYLTEKIKTNSYEYSRIKEQGGYTCKEKISISTKDNIITIVVPEESNSCIVKNYLFDTTNNKLTVQE